MQTATPVPTATPGPTATPLPTDVPPLSDVLAESFSKVDAATSGFIDSLPLIVTRLLFAGVAVLIGWVLLRLGRRLIARLIQKKSKGSDARSIRERETLRALIQSIFSYLMYFFIITVVLSIFGVDVSSLLAVAGVGGIAIGFGAQTLVKDIISGIFLWSEGNITVGNKVTINGLTGNIESISLRTTTLRDFNGSLYVIPNGDIRTVTNESRGFKRAIVEVRLNYEDDLQRMLDILEDEMKRSKEAIHGLRETPKVVGVTAMTADCLTVQIAARCDPTSYSEVELELRLRIKKRFEQENIVFPHIPITHKPREESPENNAPSS